MGIGKVLLLIFAVSGFIVLLPVIVGLIKILAPFILALTLIVAVPVGIGTMIGYVISKAKGGDV